MRQLEQKKIARLLLQTELSILAVFFIDFICISQLYSLGLFLSFSLLLLYLYPETVLSLYSH